LPAPETAPPTVPQAVRARAMITIPNIFILILSGI
jgi:hypothetical protein